VRSKRQSCEYASKRSWSREVKSQKTFRVVPANHVEVDHEFDLVVLVPLSQLGGMRLAANIALFLACYNNRFHFDCGEWKHNGENKLMLLPENKRNCMVCTDSSGWRRRSFENTSAISITAAVPVALSTAPGANVIGSSEIES